jgi:hypothetical protein
MEDFPNVAKIGYLVDHRFYCNLHGWGSCLFQFSRLIALGFVPG